MNEKHIIAVMVVPRGDAAVGILRSIIKQLQPDDVTPPEENLPVLVTAFRIQSYDLADHQFVKMKVKTNKKRELVFLISRQYVVGIVEGEGLKKEDFGFANKS